MGKLPSFQFYPGDWRKDAGLQSCSLTARGLWIELLIAMFEGPDRYTLMNPDGTPWTIAQMSRCVGDTPGMVRRALEELETAGVSSRDDEGRLYSRRLQRDRQIREARAEAGAKGGRAYRPKQTGSKPEANTQANSQAKRGSSSSTSSSSSPSGVKATPPRFQPPSPEEVADYCRERGNGVDAQRFVDFYTSKGWLVGKAKMRDWKAAVRNWEREEKGKAKEDHYVAR